MLRLPALEWMLTDMIILTSCSSSLCVWLGGFCKHCPTRCIFLALVGIENWFPLQNICAGVVYFMMFCLSGSEELDLGYCTGFHVLALPIILVSPYLCFHFSIFHLCLHLIFSLFFISIYCCFVCRIYILLISFLFL